ncbi:hypothetical protein BGZ61DRAFT_443620 [Ilyonectria robusta]|uniref:uncharacterized protein n=1 Tax=Ilyonectria robusta TaxID=1079257 RepID=UPI001E8CC140|nr:uncharacterized protein BGZ61DRAFT_443620 [Ilyonectria robusta]KAH8735047.1 hypothetical protein BGZ61DRAFT_443620 [Ilyonectria robusta]
MSAMIRHWLPLFALVPEFFPSLRLYNASSHRRGRQRASPRAASTYTCDERSRSTKSHRAVTFSPGPFLFIRSLQLTPTRAIFRLRLGGHLGTGESKHTSGLTMEKEAGC